MVIKPILKTRTRIRKSRVKKNVRFSSPLVINGYSSKKKKHKKKYRKSPRKETRRHSPRKETRKETRRHSPRDKNSRLEKTSPKKITIKLSRTNKTTNTNSRKAINKYKTSSESKLRKSKSKWIR